MSAWGGGVREGTPAGRAGSQGRRLWLCAKLAERDDGGDALRESVSGALVRCSMSWVDKFIRLYMAPEILRSEKYDAKVRDRIPSFSSPLPFPTTLFSFNSFFLSPLAESG